MTFPAGLTVIEVTGLNLLALDGTPLSGTVIFSVVTQVAVPGVSALLQGSATAEVVNGVMAPVTIPTTDCVSPGFSYTITQRLTTPDGVTGAAAPAQNVLIPSALGASVDLSALVPSAPLPPVTAFTSANTWAQPQTFEGSPAVVMPGGAAAGYVWTSDADGDGSWQPHGGSGSVTSVSGVNANGFTVSVASGTTTPAVTAGTSVAGLLKGNGTGVSAATAGTDYLAPNGSGAALTGITAAQVGADASGAAAAAQAAAVATSLQKSANLSDLVIPSEGYQQLGGGHSGKLQGWFAALANRHYSRANIVVIGDSVSAGQGASAWARSYTQLLAGMLRARFPTAGLATGGGRGFLQPKFPLVGGWSAPYITITGSPPLVGGYGPALNTYDVKSPAVMTWTLSGDYADIMWLASTGDGSFSYAVDGGATTTVATGGSNADGQLTRVALGASGPHALVVQGTSGTDTYVSGVIEYDGDTSSGIQVHGCALAGSKTTDWTAAGGMHSQPQAAAALSPGLIIIELGLNDAADQPTIPTFTADLQATIAQQRAAYATPPPVLLLATYSAFNDGSVSPATWQTFVAAMYAIAAADAEIDVLDLSLRMPNTIASNTWGLYASDGIHPSDNGHAMIADALCSFLSPA